jgi:flagellar M-ring protein FliF
MAAETQNAAANLLRNVANMPVRQKLLLMVSTAAIVALAVGAWLWGTAPDYRVLFSNLSDRDGGAIIAQLSQMNVPYKFTDGGGAIMVPSGKVYDTRLRLASLGLPKGGNTGFDLAGTQKFGTTRFQEQVNYQRALAGELARSIQSLSAVRSARVHLAIPKPSVFLRDQEHPSASVLVTLYPGRTLDRAQVSGIRYLVASSVPDLATKNVSIIDQNGVLLSGPGDSDGDNLDPGQLAYVQKVEHNAIRRIQDIIEPIVGKNNVRVQVSADVDFSRTESTAQTFAPNGNPDHSTVRNKHSSESVTTGTSQTQGVPGALSNQPPAKGVAPIAAPQTADTAAAGSTQSSDAAAPVPTSTQKDTTVSYAVDKTIRHTRNPVGAIKRLSAAVVVNFRTTTNAKGQPESTPLPLEQMSQIRSLVKEAMGFDQARGDSVNVVNAPFSVAKKVAAPKLPLWQRPDMIALARDAGKALLLAVLAAWFIFGLLRPTLRQLTVPPALPAPEPAAALDTGTVVIPATENNLQRARQLAAQDPKIVANVVKAWVNKDE